MLPADVVKKINAEHKNFCLTATRNKRGYISLQLQTDNISICVCTYKRAEMLSRVIEGILGQITEDNFTFEIIIVDNDSRQTAKQLVEQFQQNSAAKIIYDCEPEQNISLARNRAIENANGNIIVFIDDDEFPKNRWLLDLHMAKTKFKADGVLGPVIPYFENSPPKWLIRSGLCNRSTFQTGTILNNPKYMRTGNVLIMRHILKDLKMPFDSRHGRTGGEDAHFFKNRLNKGYSFVWCNEAAVHEEVPEDRQTLRYFIKRAFIQGVTSADQQSLISTGTFKSLIAVFLYTLGLPFLLLLGYHHFVKYLVKDCDHIAKLLAHFGIKLARIRTF
jgi:glycosyltransferase involved in cell wall biosynthesis